MAYQEDITRLSPSAFLFLVDQSGSMGALFGRPSKSGSTQTKADVVAEAINSTVGEIINRCRKPEGIYDYFEIGIIGYGQTTAAAFCWERGLAGKQMMPLSEIDRSVDIKYVEEEVFSHGKTAKETIPFSVWLNPTAVGGTPMKSALELAQKSVADWVQQHQDSYPPIVINITDGAATDIENDQQLINAAQAITSIANRNGSNVLLINCHISERADAPVVFPSKSNELPADTYAQTLFQMSSVLPPQMSTMALSVLGRQPSNDPIRGMVFNGNAVILVKFLDIGTKHNVDKPES